MSQSQTLVPDPSKADGKPVEVQVAVGDVQIGAVEIKDSATSERASVNNGALAVEVQNPSDVGEVTIAQPDSSTVVSVAAGTTSGTIRGANGNRKGMIVYNDAGTTMYLKLGPGASLNSWSTKLFQDSSYELPFPVYTGVVTAVWNNGANGNCQVTELT